MQRYKHTKIIWKRNESLVSTKYMHVEPEFCSFKKTGVYVLQTECE